MGLTDVLDVDLPGVLHVKERTTGASEEAPSAREGLMARSAR